MRHPTPPPRHAPLRAVVVLGYGCHLTPVVRRFLDAVAHDIDATRVGAADPPPFLITSGGFTNQRTAPGVSEARRFADYLGSRGVDLPVLLDEAARTTLENLRHVGALLAAHDIAAHEAVICCDAVREAKIRHVARHLWGATPTLWRYDLGRTRLQSLLQRTAGLAYDAAALRLPRLERLGLRLIDARNARA